MVQIGVSSFTPPYSWTFYGRLEAKKPYSQQPQFPMGFGRVFSRLGLLERGVCHVGLRSMVKQRNCESLLRFSDGSVD